MAHEVRVVSAHRTPDLLFEYADAAVTRGLRVIIAWRGKRCSATSARHGGGKDRGAGAGGTNRRNRVARAWTRFLSIVQMPKGVIPVGTLAIGAAGAANAGLLAIAILATTDPALQQKLTAWREARPR